MEAAFLKCACPHCTQHIEYPREAAGSTVPCPSCQREFILPPLSPAFEVPNKPKKLTAKQRLETLDLDTEGMTDKEARQRLKDPLIQAREFMQYLESDEGLIDEQESLVNLAYEFSYREVTREEVARAWRHAKAKKGENPDTEDVRDALEELFEDFRRKPEKEGIYTQYCIHCRGAIEIPFPTVAPTRKITIADFVPTSISCPHCGRQIEVDVLRL